MGVYIMETFVIDETNTTDRIEVTAGGSKVFFGSDSGHFWFELTKEEWEELKAFVDEKI